MRLQFGLIAVLALGLVACGQDDNQKTAAAAPALAAPEAVVEVVAQPEQETIVEIATQETPMVIEAVDETVEEVAAAVAETAQAVEAMVTQVSGEELYVTCIGCHGAAGEGGVGPKLQGQSVSDLTKKLAIYKAGNEIGPMSAMMIPNATGLSDSDIIAVSEYMAGL